MQKAVTYMEGCLSISKNFLHLYDSSIHLNSISNLEPFTFPKRPIFANIKIWLYGLLIMFIIAAFRRLYWVGDLYIYSVFLLIGYNIWKRRKNYYGLAIELNNGKTIYIQSEKIEFIYDLKKTLLNAMDNKKSDYTINLNTNQIINNIKQNDGIISNGNNNKNEIKGVKKYD